MMLKRSRGRRCIGVPQAVVPGGKRERHDKSAHAQGAEEYASFHERPRSDEKLQRWRTIMTA